MQFNLTPSEVISFWSYVNRTGECWLWTGQKNGRLYGQFAVRRDGKKKKYLAHRISWELRHGPISDGLKVCHNCPTGDDPRCIRPEHLFIGTQLDNMRDMSRKGRAATGARNGTRTHPEKCWMITDPGLYGRGEHHPRAKLTNSDVFRIRSLAAERTHTLRDIAARHGVSESSVADILHGRSWKRLA